MKIDIRTVGDVQVLDCTGKITLGEGTLTVRKTLKAVLDSGTRKIILNLKDVSYIDSSGLGELMRTHNAVSSAGGQLRLLNITQRTRELLSISKLLTIFAVYDDEQTALVSFDQPTTQAGTAGR